MERITKLTAAQRQLDCAIRLFFNCDDSLSVHTLAWAAFKILFDIYPHHRSDGFTDDLDTMIEGMGWRKFAHTPNFLKHADRDPLDHLSNHDYEATLGQIGMAVILYSRIASRYTPEMRAFDDFIQFMHPDDFNIQPDPDPDIERSYRQSLEILSGEPFEVRMTIGKALLQHYRENPDLPRLAPFQVKPHKPPEK